MTSPDRMRPRWKASDMGGLGEVVWQDVQLYAMYSVVRYVTDIE